MRSKGFSLIELMVVIAIVSVLAAVAVPSYSDYIAKSRIAEVNALIGQKLQEWAQNDALGNGLNNGSTGSGIALGSYITSIVLNSGTVVVTLNSSTNLPTVVRALVLTYTPTTQTAGVVWACTFTSGGSGTTAQKQVYFDKCS